MGGLYLGVRGPPVADVLFFKEAQRVDRNLVHLAGEAADAGPGRELVEAADAIFLGQKPNKYGLHLILPSREYTTNPRADQAGLSLRHYLLRTQHRRHRAVE